MRNDSKLAMKSSNDWVRGVNTHNLASNKGSDDPVGESMKMNANHEFANHFIDRINNQRLQPLIIDGIKQVL